MPRSQPGASLFITDALHSLTLRRQPAGCRSADSIGSGCSHWSKLYAIQSRKKEIAAASANRPVIVTAVACAIEPAFVSFEPREPSAPVIARKPPTSRENGQTREISPIFHDQPNRFKTPSSGPYRIHRPSMAEKAPTNPRNHSHFGEDVDETACSSRSRNNVTLAPFNAQVSSRQAIFLARVLGLVSPTAFRPY